MRISKLLIVLIGFVVLSFNVQAHETKKITGLKNA